MRFSYLNIFFLLFLFSCAQNMKSIKTDTETSRFSFASKGFALIYDDYFFSEKIVNKKLNNEKKLCASVKFKKKYTSENL